GVYVAEGRGGVWPRMVELEKQAFAKALRKRARISFGTDAGGFAWSENQAKEFGFMVRYGMTPMQAIQSATTVAAALLGESQNLGELSAGHLAYVVAVEDGMRLEYRAHGRTVVEITEPEGMQVQAFDGPALVAADTVPVAFDALPDHYYRMVFQLPSGAVREKKLQARANELLTVRL